VSPPNENVHACDWREYAKHLEDKLREKEIEVAKQDEALAKQDEESQGLKEQLEAMKRRSFGRKSEKLPSTEREIRKQKQEENGEAQKAEALRKRRENAVAKMKLKTIETAIAVPEEKSSCPSCGSSKLRSVGKGKTSTVIEYVPSYFRRRVYRRETLKCPCGKYMVTAPPPEKATEGSRYDEGFVAHLMVSKCGDSIPLYRLEKQYRRAGLSITRGTMNELLHRHAELLQPLVGRLLERIGESEVVLADETTIKLHHSQSKAWMWVFLSGNLIAYRFSKDRSGKTPRAVLGASKGTLVVDAYTGYNSVVGAEGRERAGCLAHARRKLFEARNSDESVSDALDFIREVYRVEHDAKETGMAQSLEHLELRQKRAAPAMKKLKGWLDTRQRIKKQE